MLKIVYDSRKWFVPVPDRGKTRLKPTYNDDNIRYSLVQLMIIYEVTKTQIQLSRKMCPPIFEVTFRTVNIICIYGHTVKPSYEHLEGTCKT